MLATSRGRSFRVRTSILTCTRISTAFVSFSVFFIFFGSHAVYCMLHVCFIILSACLSPLLLSHVFVCFFVVFFVFFGPCCTVLTLLLQLRSRCLRILRRLLWFCSTPLINAGHHRASLWQLSVLTRPSNPKINPCLELNGSHC